MSNKILVGQVRIMGSTEADTRELAKRMGITLTQVKRGREVAGCWIGYGVVSYNRHESKPASHPWPTDPKQLALWLDTCSSSEREAWKMHKHQQG